MSAPALDAFRGPLMGGATIVFTLRSGYPSVPPHVRPAQIGS